jgi:hypothetical protein
MTAHGSNKISTLFYNASEPYAGGYFEYPDRSRFFRFARAQRRFWEKMTMPPYVGGRGYTHSIPNYGRIIKEGLESYEKRIKQLPISDFSEGLLEILEGIHIYQDRALNILERSGAPDDMIAAFKHVPFLPAANLYEALLAWNYIFYIDWCDDPGRLDADLNYLYRGENIMLM